MVYEKRERTMYQFCYILIIGFKGATSNISNIKQKGTEYSTGYRVLPSTLESLHDMEKMRLFP